MELQKSPEKVAKTRIAWKSENKLQQIAKTRIDVEESQ